MLETSASLGNSFDVNGTGNTLPGLNASGLMLSGTAYGLSGPFQQTTNISSSFNLPSIEALNAGVFTVGETGKVSFDYLFDVYTHNLSFFKRRSSVIIELPCPKQEDL